MGFKIRQPAFDWSVLLVLSQDVVFLLHPDLRPKPITDATLCQSTEELKGWGLGRYGEFQLWRVGMEAMGTGRAAECEVYLKKHKPLSNLQSYQGSHWFPASCRLGNALWYPAKMASSSRNLAHAPALWHKALCTQSGAFPSLRRPPSSFAGYSEISRCGIRNAM